MKTNTIKRNTFFAFIAIFFIAISVVAVFSTAGFRTVSAYAMESEETIGCEGIEEIDREINESFIEQEEFEEFENIMMLSGGSGRSSNEGIISGTTASTIKRIIPDTRYAMTAANFSNYLKFVSFQSTSIATNAFSGCTKLSNLEVSSNVTSIGTYAFYGCTGMLRIYIPSSVTIMGSNVFQNCSSLYVYTGATSKPSGWNSSWNSSNRPVYWLFTPFTKDVFSGFGYYGSTYYWKGAVGLTLSSVANCYQNTSNGHFLFKGNTTLTFATRTVSSRNAWSKINGTLSFSGVLTHTTSVSVSITNSVTINNGSFSINTANLANGTYTLTLNSYFTRASWSGSSTHAFTFVVDK